MGHSGAEAAVAKDGHPEAQHFGIDYDTSELLRILSAFKSSPVAVVLEATLSRILSREDAQIAEMIGSGSLI